MERKDNNDYLSDISDCLRQINFNLDILCKVAEKLSARENGLIDPVDSALGFFRSLAPDMFPEKQTPKIKPSKERADEINLFEMEDGTRIGLDANMIVIFEQGGECVTVPWAALMSAIQCMRNSKDAYLKSKHQGE